MSHASLGLVFRSLRPLPLLGALASLTLTCAAQGLPRVTAAPPSSGPPGAITSGLPNAAGLGSGAPPQHSSPVGVGSGAEVMPTPRSTGRYVYNPDAASDVRTPETNVLGAAAAYSGVVYGGAPGAWSTVDIARSFLLADTNRDGELTRAEAQRLSIAPYSFDEMDWNHDGILSRFEYEDATR